MQQSLIGHTLLERYRVAECLGEGSNGVVYKAQQLNLARFVTLKVVERDNRAGYERLQQESRVLAQFHHPGIRQVYSIESAGPFVFAVLDYAEQSLKDLIRERREQKQVFSRDETVGLLRPIAQVLDYLHSRGWAHMDIKPENILVATDGRVLLADFGVAQPFGKAQSRGTPTHVAPEVVNAQEVSAATDLYSLAVVAYEMLAGRLPFLGETPVTFYRQHAQAQPPLLDRLAPQATNSVAWVVNQALSKDPKRRYISAIAFLDTLERADTISVRLPTLPRRRPIPTAVTAASVVGVSALIFGLGPLLSQIRPAPTPVVVAAPSAPAVSTHTPVPRMSTPPQDTMVVLTPKITLFPSAGPTVTQAPLPTSTTAPVPTVAPSSTATAIPMTAACQNAEAVPGASIVYPAANTQLAGGKIAIRGTANLPTSTEYEFQYRSEERDAPNRFHFIDGSTHEGKVDNGELGVWDTSAIPLPPGAYILKLRVKLNDGNYKDCDVPIVLK